LTKKEKFNAEFDKQKHALEEMLKQDVDKEKHVDVMGVKL
jgi:hypothetical protein